MSQFTTLDGIVPRPVDSVLYFSEKPVSCSILGFLVWSGQHGWRRVRQWDAEAAVLDGAGNDARQPRILGRHASCSIRRQNQVCADLQASFHLDLDLVIVKDPFPYMPTPFSVRPPPGRHPCPGPDHVTGIMHSAKTCNDNKLRSSSVISATEQKRQLLPKPNQWPRDQWPKIIQLGLCSETILSSLRYQIRQALNLFCLFHFILFFAGCWKKLSPRWTTIIATSGSTAGLRACGLCVISSILTTTRRHLWQTRQLVRNLQVWQKPSKIEREKQI